MKRLSLSLVLLLVCSGVAFAALHFPPLTGRVVDEAHVLSSYAVASLNQQLAEYENGTTNQVVVVTLPNLQGDSIEDYGYQLGRAWGIGQKGKNNGMLLIVVPSEHKVRIEVGYGLEGTLTDSDSSVIINQIILPDLRAGHMEQGITDGTTAILSALGGKGVPLQSGSQTQPQSSVASDIFTLLALVLFIILAVRHPFLTLFLLNTMTSRSGSSGIGGGGGFSGGGGSFGGGGASGGW
jgi:uncharacterized protein